MKVRIRTDKDVILAIVDLDWHLYGKYEFVPKISPLVRIRTQVIHECLCLSARSIIHVFLCSIIVFLLYALTILRFGGRESSLCRGTEFISNLISISLITIIL